ncbi:NtaA/DmoA family FMN-dependent monooxygenase [Streptosporangium sp. NBC_01639]|uniref:NtaA/DmoA family FMN-dependent monooxygenase n=1 Tax=Streptosporangium sp. NBC_01639 TaxID=2975948 RepID=UPI0038637E5E|nr:NtaA/DmoA family FMN-dependent monooxygenase [Streptosporangium sp. NBC_01639]
MKQVILAAHFPGVNNQTVWSDPASGSQIDFASFTHLARTAERGRFDFFFLADGQRLREQRGRIHDLDVVGRPDSLTVLSGLAAVTTHLGLAATVNATFNEPYDLARRIATLDHLSGGRAGWNVVTSSDAFTGENFRRGGYLDHSQRYERAEEFVRTTRELWDSWAAEDLVADPATGTFATREAGAFAHRGTHFDIGGRFTVPRSPQRHPLTIQAGDSDGGREFAAATADAIFSRHGRPAEGQAFYRDIAARVAAHGRAPGSLKILPGATFALGDTDAEAQEHADHIRRQQVSPQTAILLLEQLWNRDLSAYDPEGPLPEIDPDVSEDRSIIKGRAGMYRDRLKTAAEWRALAEQKRLGIRDLIIEVTGRQSFIGSPARVAEEINESVQSDAADGFILVPHLTPTGLDEFVDKVVPLLQERGVFRTEYGTTTLRGHLGLENNG